MSFKYINPGFKAGSAFASCTEVSTTESRFAAGQVLEWKKNINFDLPEAGKTFYLSYTSNDFGEAIMFFGSPNGSSYLETGFSANSVYINGVNVYAIPEIDRNFHQIFMKIHSDATNGSFELYIDGLKYYGFDGDVNHGEDLVRLSIKRKDYASASIHFGNIIISNEPISKTEKICVLTPINTVATMTDNEDGSYTATAENQSVLQKIDVEELKTKVNGGTVTGIALVGSPAYCKGGDLEHLVGMKDTVEKVTVETPVTEGYSTLASWKETLNPAALADVSLGWKAKV